jgi:hypothetical protein
MIGEKQLAGISTGGWYWTKYWTQNDRFARYTVDEIA